MKRHGTITMQCGNTLRTVSAAMQAAFEKRGYVKTTEKTAHAAPVGVKKAKVKPAPEPEYNGEGEETNEA